MLIVSEMMRNTSRKAAPGRFSRPLKEQIPFVDINQERHKAYAGYDGLLSLAKQLVHTLQHPVWELAAKLAPWEEETEFAD